jgi:hypothetical protein
MTDSSRGTVCAVVESLGDIVATQPTQREIHECFRAVEIDLIRPHGQSRAIEWRGRASSLCPNTSAHRSRLRAETGELHAPPFAKPRTGTTKSTDSCILSSRWVVSAWREVKSRSSPIQVEGHARRGDQFAGTRRFSSSIQCNPRISLGAGVASISATAWSATITKRPSRATS